VYSYPPALRGGDFDDYHGDQVADPYRWLETTTDPETASWIKAENELTESFFAAVPARESIREQLTGLWDYPRAGVPFERGGRWFQSRNPGLAAQPLLYVKDQPGHAAADGRPRRPSGPRPLVQIRRRTASRSGRRPADSDSGRDGRRPRRGQANGQGHRHRHGRAGVPGGCARARLIRTNQAGPAVHRRCGPLLHGRLAVKMYGTPLSRASSGWGSAVRSTKPAAVSMSRIGSGRSMCMSGSSAVVADV
jgi:Prolyl oligopeptidase, N-terminal beta-propeller domain